MGAAQKDKGSALGKWRFITVSILGAALVIAAIWFLSRALTNSAPQGSVALTNAATTPNPALIQEELESRQDMAAQRTESAIQAPIAEQPVVIPTEQSGDEVT